MNRAYILKLGLFILSLTLFLGCDKEPSTSTYFTKNDIVRKFKITYEAVYDRNNHYEQDGLTFRDPRYVAYDSEKYNYAPGNGFGTFQKVDFSKFYIIFKPDGRFEMYDWDNAVQDQTQESLNKGPRLGSYNLTDKNTFDISLDEFNVSVKPGVKPLQPAKYYCIVTDFGKINGKVYFTLKVRLETNNDNATPVVKEIHLLEDNTIVQQAN